MIKLTDLIQILENSVYIAGRYKRDKNGIELFNELKRMEIISDIRFLTEFSKKTLIDITNDKKLICDLNTGETKKYLMTFMYPRFFDLILSREKNEEIKIKLNITRLIFLNPDCYISSTYLSDTDDEKVKRFLEGELYKFSEKYIKNVEYEKKMSLFNDLNNFIIYYLEDVDNKNENREMFKFYMHNTGEITITYAINFLELFGLGNTYEMDSINSSDIMNKSRLISNSGLIRDMRSNTNLERIKRFYILENMHLHLCEKFSKLISRFLITHVALKIVKFNFVLYDILRISNIIENKNKITTISDYMNESCFDYASMFNNEININKMDYIYVQQITNQQQKIFMEKMKKTLSVCETEISKTEYGFSILVKIVENLHEGLFVPCCSVIIN